MCMVYVFPVLLSANSIELREKKNKSKTSQNYCVLLRICYLFAVAFQRFSFTCVNWPLSVCMFSELSKENKSEFMHNIWHQWMNEPVNLFILCAYQFKISSVHFFYSFVVCLFVRHLIATYWLFNYHHFNSSKFCERIFYLSFFSLSRHGMYGTCSSKKKHSQNLYVKRLSTVHIFMSLQKSSFSIVH